MQLADGKERTIQHIVATTFWHQDGTLHREANIGDGPVDAVFKTIERITGVTVTLRDFQVRSVTVGEDAQGEAQIEAELNGRILRGRAVSTDIIEASALAFLQVINRIALRNRYLLDRVLPTQHTLDGTSETAVAS